MSEIAFAHAEVRIQRFLLGPVWGTCFSGAAVSAYHRAWFFLAAYILLMLYAGRIGSRLKIHRGKSVSELSQGITPDLPPNSDGDLSIADSQDLVPTIVKIFYVVDAEILILLLAGGVRLYWALLIGLVVWWLGSGLAGVAAALVSTPTVFRRKSKKSN